MKSGQAEFGVGHLFANQDSWNQWRGGKCPVDVKQYVEVKTKDGQTFTDMAMMFLWKHIGSDADILAWRKVDLKPDPDAVATNWFDWQGGACPVHPETMVGVQLRNGNNLTRQAGGFRWQHNPEDAHFDIVRYRQIAFSREPWTEWAGGDCPLWKQDKVEVELSNGRIKSGVAENFDWTHMGNNTDIIRYRMIEQVPAIAANPTPPVEVRKHSHYFKPCPFEYVDVYRVLQLFEVTDPCIQHAIKKLLVAGGRGAKDTTKDIKEAIDSLQRWQDMRKEEQ